MKHRQRLELGLVSWRLGLDFFRRFVYPHLRLLKNDFQTNTLPESNSEAPEEWMVGIRVTSFLLGRLIFQVRAVSFREGKKMRFQVKGKVHSVHPHIQELNRCSKKSNCFCKKTLYKQTFWWGGKSGKSLPTLPTSMLQKMGHHESPVEEQWALGCPWYLVTGL